MSTESTLTVAQREAIRDYRREVDNWWTLQRQLKRAEERMQQARERALWAGCRDTDL